MSQFLYRPYLDNVPIEGAFVVIEAADDSAARIEFARLWAARTLAANRANLYNLAGKIIWDTDRL